MNNKQIENAILNIQNLKLTSINERERLFWLVIKEVKAGKQQGIKKGKQEINKKKYMDIGWKGAIEKVKEVIEKSLEHIRIGILNNLDNQQILTKEMKIIINGQIEFKGKELKTAVDKI